MPTPVRRVALLSIDPWRKLDGNYRPFNYPVRKIEAAIRAAEGFDDVEVRVFDTLEANAAALAADLEQFDPDVVGASTYLWSFTTFLDVADRVRARRPDTTFIMGGPSARPEMFALEPFVKRSSAVDALVLGEGEEIILDILRASDRSPAGLRHIPGLAIFGGEQWQNTADRPLPDLSKLPSPYQMNLVPHGYTAHIETFRGCPLSCSFCQWGDLSKASRSFSTEYLVRELEGFQRMEARGTAIVDAALNLNPRAFRNLVAAEKQVRFIQKTHFNTEIYPSHMTHEHLDFLEMIEADSVGIGLQSYDKAVLERVQRPFHAERFERVVRDVANIVPDTVVEIILGLPGDNLDSFRRTLDRARELPVGVRIYRCLVLPNALMSRAPAHFDMEFDPHTLQMQSCWGWSRDDIERGCEEITAMIREEEGDMNDGCNSWKIARRDETTRRRAMRNEGERPDEPAERPLDAHLRDLIVRNTSTASDGHWTLQETTANRERLRMNMETPLGNLRIEVTPVHPDKKHFCVQAGMAFSYQTGPNLQPGASELRILQRVADLLGPVLRKEGPWAVRERKMLPVVE